ncbi:oligosaccharide flippase family protein [Photobacterium sp. CCB-ST2H9]|uniref:oligosaccharide flippase family protein n=1 Tax=unclassified Photobacterium TaxID=2628852 RepID=UPI002002E974|nr:oligosaccharide flippase family protein [Photobacterium sp. CCB-ST2H9]UTM59940.1 oligosaccharide flippase family protein [Photobacterium sp. CCB-ST2H9]
MADKYSQAIFSGAKWTLLMIWYNRCIGLISTLVLVRLLSPEDYGVAGFAMFFVYFFIALSTVGTKQYVLMENTEDEEKLNSIWSLNLLFRLVSAVILWFSADYIASYANEPKLALVVKVVSVIPLLRAFHNVGMDVFEKNFNFKMETVMLMVAKTLGTVCTILLAFIVGNYWALVAGVMLMAVMEVSSSYMLCPFRPRWSTRYWKEQWYVSKWLYLVSVSGYLRSRMDMLVLGNLLSSRDIGFYNMAQEFSWLPYTDFLSPMNRGAFSVFAKFKDNEQLFKERLYSQLALLMLLVMPVSFGMCAISEDFVHVILGQKWLAVIPVMQHLSFLMIVMTLYMVVQTVLILKSKMPSLFLWDCVAIVLVIVGFYGLGYDDPASLSMVRLIVGCIFLVCVAIIFLAVIRLKASRFLPIVILPLLVSVLMYFCVSLVSAQIESHVMGLIVSVATGVAVYTIAMILILPLSVRWIPEYRSIQVQLGRMFRIPLTSSN